MPKKVWKYSPWDIKIISNGNVDFDETELRRSMDYFGLRFCLKRVTISSNKRYPEFHCNKVTYPLHRIIGKYKYKDLSDDFIYHHIDGNRFNAHGYNLLRMTASEHSRMHNTGNSYTIGKKWSKESKEKLSKSKKGKPAKNKKKIVMLDKHGNIVKEYDSLTEASIQNNVLISSIANNLKGNSKYCNKHQFKYL